jgi:hypothetical protein
MNVRVLALDICKPANFVYHVEIGIPDGSASANIGWIRRHNQWDDGMAKVVRDQR